MSDLTRDDVLKLAHLARLHLNDEELDHFTDEISEIIGYVAQLKDADVAGLNPTNQVTGLKNVTRPDESIEYGATCDDLLMNAPDKEDNYFKVKRMIA